MKSLLFLGICGWVFIVFITATILLSVYVDPELYINIVIVSEILWISIITVKLLLGTPFTFNSFIGGSITWITLGSVVYDVIAVLRVGKIMSGVKEAPIEIVYGEIVEDLELPRLGSGN